MPVNARVTYALLLSLVPHVYPIDQNITDSCLHLYEKGVESYLENRYADCVMNFENALAKYHDYRQKLHNCRLKCQREADLADPLYPVDIDNLLFFERAIRNTLCIIKCKQDHRDLFLKFNINREAAKLFEDHKPYEYLQICYFQEGQVQKAASSAFTYLVLHPNNSVMIANLKHYSTLDSVNMAEVVNYEAKDYVYLYSHGADAYAKKDWDSVIQNMEESLGSYLQTEEECRAQCEGPYDQGWLPDFIPSIANHFTYALRCKQKCATKLNSLNGEKHEDLLPSHYHYLQFAYFKKGNLKEACAAVASYLLFFPEDDTMLENMKYYSRLPKATQEYFTPRPEAIRYVQRKTYERRLLKFVFNQFQFDNSLTEVKTQALNYRVIMTEKELRGPSRFVSDGLATAKECRTLVNIARMFAKLGDGYHGVMSPHTVMEKFEGVTITRATLLTYYGLLDPKHLAFFLQLTDTTRERVREHFRISRPLYFTYTHLVCRSELAGSPLNRTDFSHSIHADNCNLREDGTCKRAAPAYTWRDYSAIIYLNSDFKGGEFMFSADATGEKPQSVVRPKCGRMVAFSSGMENLHGVRAVQRGTRCAIGIWFTFDRKHEEIERRLSHKLLESPKFA